MEKIEFKLPQLILVENGLNKYKYLERISSNSKEPKVNLTFQEDSGEDDRIITIKYQIEGKKDSSVLYYSEAMDNYSLITGNLGYRYIGRVLVRDRDGNKIGVGFEHLQKERLRLNHLERISRINNIREDLTPEYVAGKYKDIFYRLSKQQ